MTKPTGLTANTYNRIANFLHASETTEGSDLAFALANETGGWARLRQQEQEVTVTTVAAPFTEEELHYLNLPMEGDL